MAQRTVRRRSKQIDPMFFIPEGVDELQYTDSNDTFTGDEEVVAIGEIVDDGADMPPENTLGVPTITGLVSQTIRRTADGRFVIDAIVTVEDSAAPVTYEIRVVKT